MSVEKLRFGGLYGRSDRLDGLSLGWGCVEIWIYLNWLRLDCFTYFSGDHELFLVYIERWEGWELSPLTIPTLTSFATSIQVFDWPLVSRSCIVVTIFLFDAWWCA